MDGIILFHSSSLWSYGKICWWLNMWCLPFLWSWNIGLIISSILSLIRMVFCWADPSSSGNPLVTQQISHISASQTASEDFTHILSHFLTKNLNYVTRNLNFITTTTLYSLWKL
jgi:hypothetical protein